MLKRLCLIVIFYTALIIDIHFYGSGIKQELTLENSFTLLVSLVSLFSFFILINAFQNRLFSAVTAFVVGFLFYFTKRIGYPPAFNLINNNIDYLKNRAGLKWIGHLTTLIAKNSIKSD